MDKINNRLSVESTELLTQKQLERAVSQKFFELYRRKVGCSPKKVTCFIFDKVLVILAEGASTSLEIAMQEKGKGEIVSAIRHSVNRVVKTEIRKIVEELAAVKITDLCCEINSDSHRLVATAILEKAPLLRSKKSKIKHR